jgi:hypothetical protein
MPLVMTVELALMHFHVFPKKGMIAVYDAFPVIVVVESVDVIELIDDEFVPNERKDKNEIEIKF